MGLGAAHRVAHRAERAITELEEAEAVLLHLGRDRDKDLLVARFNRAQALLDLGRRNEAQSLLASIPDDAFPTSEHDSKELAKTRARANGRKP
jgi:hypothetical protein